MKAETFADVFDALADTPKEAANLKARADLLTAIRDRVKRWGVPEGEAAGRLGITRPRLNDLTRGKLDKFSLDALVNIAAAARLDIEIRVKEIA
ncbi:MAG: XRE family transcriptional regulator [Desulfovibrionaceae bacterium]|jgi:predicted XRE-type DNA-binding protein|nr:XRE family transcriptional regulator [Desulfovibrionaceae bacterium]